MGDNYIYLNPNNPVVILRSRWSLRPAKVPIEDAVLFKLYLPVNFVKVLIALLDYAYL